MSHIAGEASDQPMEYPRSPPHPQVVVPFVPTPQAYAQPYPPAPQMYYPPQQYAAPMVVPYPSSPPVVYVQPGQVGPPGATVYMMPMGPQALQPQPIIVTVPANRKVKGQYYDHAVAALVLHILGLTAGFFICEIPSIALSLHMVAKGAIKKRDRPAVIGLSIMELIAIAFLPAFVWYSKSITDCYNSFFFGTSCYTYEFWLGWITFIVFFVFAICFGIPRTVLTWKARYQQRSQQPHQ
eukprot:TRINITY_DN7905_c0_g1_i1.p1 TRINITY_DN7905_c0_g1~~TRINITY_DN7905_c0_g1_i1.p1  ORF type:complete len:255 (+),score=46.82 TRINITY_DN7905_c0_g1_i1:51-767(+)